MMSPTVFISLQQGLSERENMVKCVFCEYKPAAHACLFDHGEGLECIECSEWIEEELKKQEQEKEVI
jgi:hypothetical protein